MTTQEQQMLRGLADRINQTQLPEKDVEAEQLVRETLGRNPDALYIMAQTVLVQQYALDQAQKQVVDLRGQLDQTRQHASEPKHSTSFLGNLLGHHGDPPRTAPPSPPPGPSPYASAGYGPGLAYPSGGYPIPGAPQQGGGFLRSAMQTATGVAAGALAFEGIETLMHGFGHAAGYGTEFSGTVIGAASPGGGRPREMVNDYYGGDATHEHGTNTSSSVQDRRDDVSGGNVDTSQFDKAADTNGDGKFQDASYVNTTDLSGTETDADILSGTSDTDYSSQGDDSMLSDDVGDDQGAGGGSDFSGEESGGDSDGGDSSGL